MIVTRGEKSVALIVVYHPHGAEKVTLRREAWNLIAPIVWRDCPERLLVVSDLEDGDPIEFDDDDHTESLMWLATLLNGMRPATHLVDIAHGWVTLPLSQRADFWRKSTTDKTVHAQLLGTRGQAGKLLETHVPDWLPKLVAVTEKLFVPTVGYRIHWTCANSPLGTSCIAWRDLHPDRPSGYLAMSSCPVSFAPAHDPDRSIARSAIDTLIAALKAVLADPTWLHRLEWSPTGHDLFEVETALQQWRGRLL